MPEVGIHFANVIVHGAFGGNPLDDHCNDALLLLSGTDISSVYPPSLPS